jgi:PleD family two-component response regulator
MEGQARLALKPQTDNQGLLRLLILEESNSEAQALIDLMRAFGHAVTAALIKSPLEFQAALKKQEWDLVICARTGAAFGPKQALALLGHAKVDLPVILLGDDSDEQRLAEAFNAGVRAVVPRSRHVLLQGTVQRELRDLAQRRAHRYCESMLRHSERRCQRLLESSRHAIACLRNGRLLYRNLAFECLAREHGAKTVLDLVRPEQRPRFEAMIKGIETGRILSVALELTLANAKGTPQVYVAELMAAQVHEQACVQLTLAVNRARPA